MDIEVVARALEKDMVGFKGISEWSLMGYTSLWMFLVGGLCGVVIGSFNDDSSFYESKVWQQILIGGTVITLAELTSGIILNKIFLLNIWEYTGKYQFMGQIELKNCLIWYFIMTPLVIWLDDMLTYYLYREGEPYNIFKIYYKLIKLE
ncbi:MAG: hypothetical protein Q8936_11680 [Bacillota bacterium]|nr:hypothetical protein [Bacillota bacterium]